MGQGIDRMHARRAYEHQKILEGPEDELEVVPGQAPEADPAEVSAVDLELQDIIESASLSEEDRRARLAQMSPEERQQAEEQGMFNVLQRWRTQQQAPGIEPKRLETMRKETAEQYAGGSAADSAAKSAAEEAAEEAAKNVGKNVGTLRSIF